MKKYYIFLLTLFIIGANVRAQTYCNPTFTNGSNGGYVPANVTLSGMIHNPNIGSNFYADYTASYGTEFVPNQSYSIAITPGTGFNQFFAVFIDYNDDGDFLDASETIYQSTVGAGGNLSIPFTVPNVSPNVLTRMRLITTNMWNTLTSCGNYSIGTAIDYYIFLGPNGLCNYNITSNCGSNYITKVTLAGTALNNTSNCSNNAHPLFPATGNTTATVTTGTTYLLTVNSSASSVVTCFIDYDHDLIFTGPFEFTEVYTSGTTGTMAITIPAGALEGPTFMRIRSRNAGEINASYSSCTYFDSGETEDYIINVQESGRFSCINDGAVMTSCSGVFTDGSGPGYNYSFSSDCSWLIQPPNASSITCSFYDVGLEPGDYAFVYDGINSSAPSLGIVSSTFNSTFTANSGAMFIHFQSGGLTANEGFTAHYTSNGNCNLPCENNLQTNNCGLDNIYSVAVTPPTFYTCNLSNISWPCTGNAYSNFPPLNCITSYIVAGDESELGITFSASDGSAIAAWVDLNQNNIFENNEMIISNNSTFNPSETALFTVPSSAVFGPMKLRVRLRSNGAIAPSDACTSFNTGETEDYTLFIISANAASTAVAPNAAFTANATNIAVGGSVNFSDLSSNSPTSWNWTFTGANTTSSTAQNPSNIVYNNVGCYTVTLNASNSIGSDTQTQTCYINVGNAAAGCNELFFSEYLEGSSNNKALEVFNPKSTAIDLSNYSIEVYANGASIPTHTQLLTGLLASHDTYVLANTGAVAGILNLADITSTACNFNGDDAIVLKNGTNVIDVIGVVGVDPGNYWPAGTGSTLDNTLIRNTNVDGPSASWNTVQNQWTASASNTFTNLGLHASVCMSVATQNDMFNPHYSINMYPNPSSEHITLDIKSMKTEKLYVEIINLLGAVVYQTEVRNTKSEINISALETGIYLVRVLDTNHSTIYTHHMIKE